MLPNIMRLYIVVFGWYLMVLGVAAGRINGKNNGTEITLLDKFEQHDYKLDFERVELVRYDKQYMKFVNVVTFKHNRTSPVVNASKMYTIDVGSNLEATVQAYRFTSNEYRTFPIRFLINFCDAFKKNVFGFGDFRKCGTFTRCPLEKGKNYSICNWAPNPSKFPPLVPTGQYMLEVQASYRSTELFVVRGYGTVHRPVPILD